MSFPITHHAMTLAQKREALQRRTMYCGMCGSRQVQLVDWINVVRWKCRKCKHKWEE